ncbi:MAG: TRAP transporter large permease [Lachnospiraceae bacterium]|nr:TRAP transporter large permease [Lachnospiraceae bacterium]
MAMQSLAIIIIVLVVLLVVGIPISYAIGISALVAILQTVPLDVSVLTAAQRTFVGMSKFSLTAIPFFVLAGNLMNQGGIAKRLVDFVLAILGKLPGALLVTNVGANALFGAISGSASAAAAAVGSMVQEGEEEQGYDRALCAATNGASAPSGLLIPPSNALITYSLVSGGTSVAALFLAGYLPGILWAVCCVLVAVVIAKRKGYKGTPGKFDWKNLGTATLRAIPSLSLIIVVIGGIIAGIFTATEGSAIAVVYALILGICYRNITIKSFWKIVVDSAKMSGMIVFLIGVSNILGWVMAFTQIPQAISAALLGLTDSRIIILLIMNVILLVAGTFMDVTPAILIFTPLFLPIVKTFGMHPVQFGLILVYNLCIGNITPPVGNTLFVAIKVGKTSLSKVMPYMLMYYVAILAGLLMITYIPAISMALPSMAGMIK